MDLLERFEMIISQKGLFESLASMYNHAEDLEAILNANSNYRISKSIANHE